MSDETPGYGYFENPEHALIAGFVWGVAMRHGVDMRPQTDSEGNYTGVWELRDPELPVPDMVILLRVLPYRPELPPDPTGLRGLDLPPNQHVCVDFKPHDGTAAECSMGHTEHAGSELREPGV